MKTPTTNQLLVLGALLILINTIVIALNGMPIIISSYPVSLTPEQVWEDLVASNNPWWRISFGVYSLVEGSLIFFWIGLASVNLLLVILTYFKRERAYFLIMLFSILSIFAGGGFVIGLLLAVIGSSMGLQSSIPTKETFFGRLILALKLDSEFYGSIKEKTQAPKYAMAVVVFINVLSGLGGSVYVYNAQLIINSTSPETAFRILLLGDIFVDGSAFWTPFIYIGVGIMKWLLLSFLLYLIGGMLWGGTEEFGKIAQSTAFAYTPIGLQVFLPFVFSNEPLLTTHWPLAIFLVTNIWMLLALLTAIKKSMNLAAKDAISLVALCSTLYWLIVQGMMNPVLHIPGIQFALQPLELVLALVSCSVVLSILLGTFSKR